jgi:amino acid adenylation domain-containing protein
MTAITESTANSKLLEGSEGPSAEFARDKCIHDLIEEQVARTPELVAVVCGKEQLTYRELNERANVLAVELQRLGVGPDVPVGLCVNRSLDMTIGLLGILKSGGCYLPLDPNYPAERIAFMLEDAKPPVLLTQTSVRKNLKSENTNTKILCLDDSCFTNRVSDVVNPPTIGRQSPTSLAYLIYTSGSTGKPKGVMVTHSNVVNFFAGMDRVLGCDAANANHHASPIWLAVTSICFDISVLELFWTLARGFTVVIRESNSDITISEQILHHRVTHFQCTPSLAGNVIRERFAGPALQQIEQFLIGGEALPSTLASQLRGILRGQLINMYGPTETTVWSAAHHIEVVQNSVPIGRPIANTQIYILDEILHPIVNGDSGEIFIGGEGVARGYYNRPELTAEKFVLINGERLYRTGDIGRFRPDGEIEFLGRVDQQVKLHGHRIELGEIEAALGRLPGIRECAVRLWEFGNGDTRLAAYLVAEAATSKSSEDVREFLKQSLPDYMIPSSFTFLEKFPLTPNGKLDRNALPKPEQTRPNLQTEFVAPKNSTEEGISKIWREVLGIESVGTKDNFFDLGGTSLLVAEMQVRIRATLGIDLPIVRLFEHPTIGALAEFIVSRNNSTLNGVRERVQRQREIFSRRQSQVVPA